MTQQTIYHIGTPGTPGERQKKPSGWPSKRKSALTSMTWSVRLKPLKAISM